MEKVQAFQKIGELVRRFEEQYDFYKNAEYNETLTRRDFIDPFFKALGWDVDNENGYAESYREVIHEDKVKIGSATKAPDYSFRLVGGKRLFFVEAKKPSISVKEDLHPAYQVRRYGWSAKLAISVVTDFEEFAIYDCTIKPSQTDKASVARIRYLTFRDYLNEFDFLWETFSKQQVLKGSFDKFIQTDAHKKGTATVEKVFLKSLDDWRTYLATSISWNNKELEEEEINFVVQQTIDRIIFLRIAEDRGIEPENSLKYCLKSGVFYQNLFELFKTADQKYNSGLFDFSRDKVSATIVVENKVIKNIVEELYYPSCEYEFSVMPVEILGTAYEQFLGKIIRITPAHHAKIEEKTEVRKAGGVYYTPQYIVDYIVSNTVGKLTNGKTPEEVSRIKIVDPACGSGSFLLGAFQYLLDWHKNFYTNNGKPSKGGTQSLSKGSKNNPLTPYGNLTTAEKKRILLNNIYGVDIDVNAVEVTKLSLLLKCLEGETVASIETQFRLFNERVLPSLDNNIKDGNSLVDIDFYESVLDFGDDKKVNPFNWKKAFPEVFRQQIVQDQEPIIEKARKAKQYARKAMEYATEVENMLTIANEPTMEYGDPGFDILIGNPPYVRQELLGDIKNYLESHYRVYHGMADLYSYFMEKGIKLLNRNGILGIIVANKWMRSNYGEPLRKYLKTQTIHEIIDFGDLPVFESVTTYPCILIAGKPSAIQDFYVTYVKSLQFDSLQIYVDQNRKSAAKTSLDDGGWNLGDEKEQSLLKKIQQAGVPLAEYVKGAIYYGIKTGLNEAFVINEVTKNRLIGEDEKSSEIIKPFLAGKDIKRYGVLRSDKYLIFMQKGFTNQRGNKPRSGWKWLQQNYPAVANHLSVFKLKGIKRFDKGEFWWELRACEYYHEFEKNKILLPDIALRMQATYDTESYFCGNTAYIIPVEDKFLLGILNSNLIQFCYSKLSSSIRGGYLRFIRQYLETIPVQHDENLKNQITEFVNHLLLLNKEKSQARLHSKVSQIEGRIEFCENRINELVYQLYGLTRDEIELIENVVKSL